jgi:hypothetical protein
MATEEAKIVVNIERGAFKTALKGMEGEVASSGRRMKSSLSGAFSAGLGNVKNTIKGMFSGIGGHMKTIATFGGAIGAGVLIKDALHLQTLYRNIAYNMSKIPGQAMRWQDVQAVVNKTVEKTGAKAEDLATTFGNLSQEMDLESAKKTLEAIATMSTATGKSMESFTDVAIRGVEKFKISTNDLPEALAQFESLTDIGGPKLEELGRKFGLLAGAASDAGFVGAEGMKSLMNMMIQADDVIGENSERAFKNIFSVLREGGSGLAGIEKKMGGKFAKGTGGKEKMEAILAKGGGARGEFEKKLSAEGLLAFKQLVPIFDDTMKEALAAGKSRQEATTLAVKAFDDSITGANKKTRTYAQNLEAATKRLKEDPALQLQKAMNKLQEVMTSPKALASIKKLMDILPPLAEKIAALLGVVMDHPLLSGAGAVGGKLGASLVGGMVSRTLGGGFGGGPGAAGSPGMAPSAAGLSASQMGMTPAKMTMTGGGKMIVTPGTGWPMVPPDSTKMGLTGQQIGTGFAGAVAALGVGVAIGTAISGVLQSAADDLINRENKSRKAYDKIRADAANLGDINTPQKMTGARKIIERTVDTTAYEAEKLMGVEGTIKSLVGTLSALFTGGDDPFTVFKNNVARQTMVFDELNKSVKAPKTSLEDFSKTLDKINNGGTSRGPVTKPPPTPGAAPTPGK